MKRLNARQQEAANLILRGLSQAAVAKETGYSQKQLSLLMNGQVAPHFLEYVQKMGLPLAERAGITAEKVLSKINAIADDPKASRMEKLKALEMLAKHLNLLTQEVKKSSDTHITLTWEEPKKTKRVLNADSYTVLPAPSAEDAPQGHEAV